MSEEGAAAETAHITSLAKKLERLFESIPNPATGKRYTNEAAAERIKDLVAELPEDEQAGRSISPQYIWQLRRSVKDNPTLKHLRSLAALFGVEADYFLNETAHSKVAEELELVAAMRQAGIEEFALRAQGLSETGRRAVMAALEHARSVEELAKNPSGDTDTPS